jgi:hypothetical protein
MARDRSLAMARCSCRSQWMARVVGRPRGRHRPLNWNFGIFCRIWLNWRPGGALKWKVGDCQLERSGREMWKADTSKVVAPACVS